MRIALLSLLLMAFLTPPAWAQFEDEPPPVPPQPPPKRDGAGAPLRPIDPNGLIIGVSWVDRPDAKQIDATRNIRVYTYLFNNSPVSQIVDWRTRRLISKKVSCEISEDDFYGQFIIEPGEIVLMKSFYYYHTGFPGKFTFSVRDVNHTIYDVPAAPMETNKGPFLLLPNHIKQRIIDVLLANQNKQFKWWYQDY